MAHNNATAISSSYTIENVSSAYDIYTCKVELADLDNTFTSNEVQGSITGRSSVTSINVSKGMYSNTVKVSWTAEQIGNTNTRYEVFRRLLGTTDAWNKIYSTSGTGDAYNYDDNTAAPGQYYEYKVEASTNYAKNGQDTKNYFSNAMTDNGFSISTGTITGRIAYGTGTAVDSVRVNLVQSTDDDVAKSQFYSLRVNDVGGGIYLPLDTTQAKALYGQNQPFTVQMWINFDADIKNGNGNAKPMIFDVYGQNSIYAYKKPGFWRLALRCPTAGGEGSYIDHGTLLDIYPGKFYNVVVSHDGKRNWTMRLIDEDGRLWKDVFTTTRDVTYNKVNPSLTFGTNLSNVGQHRFQGYIDEIRVWTKELTDAELLRTYNHQLTGDEKGLYLYYNLDEGIQNQQTAYDYSRTGGVANGHHGIIRPSSAVSTVVPPASAFSVFGLTDSEGNYVIKGVPFSGNGTNYSVVPTYGVHSFSPAKSSRFVSQSSLNHSGVDFKDVSSFPVSGTVYYENTDYPVEGANLYVDGVICTKDGEVIVTDDQGRYTIDVPIGDHFIQIKKNGHTFVNNGRYPQDANNAGTRFTFEKPISNLRFTDNTKVVVSGRVAGGSIEAAKPLGLGLGEANIGRAHIQLSAGTYRMNVMDETVQGGIQNAKDTLFYSAASKDVNSRAYVEGGDGDKVKSIYIDTDPVTGEFAALLPPVEYKVVSVIIPANNGDDGVKIDARKLSTINATNAQLVQTDSVDTGEKAGQTFDYCAKLIVPYYVEPKLIVTQKDSKAFGDETYTYQEVNGSNKQTLKLWEEKDGKLTYNYGQPIFTQNNRYIFNIEGYEEYVNKDNTKEVKISRVPLQNSVVTIKNEFASGQIVRTDNAQIDSLQDNQLALDSLGKATYTFVAGFPNITEPYTRGLNITYESGSATKSWSENAKFKAIVLGELPTGNNFVTSGPDKVLMVLRDPPGSNSNAFYEEGTSVSHTTSYDGSFIRDNEVTTLTKLGQSFTVWHGVGSGIINTIGQTFDLTVGAQVNVEVTKNNTWTENVTTTKRISTDDSEDYVGANGDVFIGSATNVLFGNARKVDFVKQSDGTFKLDMKNGITTGMQYGTGFNYTQNYVENTLLPNFEKLRNELLQLPGTVNGNTNNTKEPIYVSKVGKDDEKFGSDNDDKEVWGSQTVSNNKLDGPSYTMILPSDYKTTKDSTGTKGKVYQDKVRWYNQQIKLWKQLLADNEAAKYEAKQNRDRYLIENTSFSAGTTIENSVAVTTGKEKTVTQQYEVLAVVGGETGFEVNANAGLSVTVMTTTGTRQTVAIGSGTEQTKTLGYTLKENGDDDALSVDIFNAPDGFGPIFLTRGGQTSCPFEDKYVTKYYQPGTELSAATMQIEVPEISVENAFATDVPSGGVANYTLIMRNNSETNEDVWFQLSQIDESNPNGAKLSIDGQALTDGRVFLVPAGKELRKQLQLTQTDLSKLDYEDIKLTLRSQCQSDPTGVWPVIADTVAITAKFVASCSDILLEIPKRVVNTQTGPKLEMTVKGYDRNFGSFQGFRIQYKGARDVDWSTVKTYVKDESLKAKYTEAEVLKDGGSTEYTFDMTNSALYPDQTYLFRAQTICMISNTETNNESDEITVVKDMARPRLLGNTSPANGILGADGEIALNFNEDIKASSLTTAANFVVNGKLNGYKVDHDVALQLNAAEAARTEATVDLSYRPFAMSFWMKRTGSGQLIKHGSAAANFTLSVNGQGKLVADIAGKKVVSTDSLPSNKWMFVQASYNYSEGKSRLTANAAYDATTLSLIDAEVPDYEGKGIIALGGGMPGAIHDLTLWDTNRSWAEAQLSRSQSKTAGTKNLIGYWKLNEGMGTAATDVARARNMKLGAANWYFAATNKSIAFNGNNAHADIDITACSPSTEDNYAFEMWFRGNKPKAGQTATLFSVNGDSVAAQFTDQGNLQLITGGMVNEAVPTNYLDSLWHHFALSVLANGSVTALIDGENVVQFTPVRPLRFQADKIVLGAMRKSQTDGAADYAFSNYFTGNIDEVRLWNAKITADVLRNRRNTRMEGSEPGLVAYYPFETVKFDVYGQAVVTNDLNNHCASDTTKRVVTLADATLSDDAPGMKSVPTLDKVSFDFTASERRVVINLLETDEALEGTMVNITLRDVRDANDNLSQPVTWSAYIKRNQLTWEKSEHTVTMERGQNAAFDVQISNMSGTPEAWTVTGLPTWLTLDAENGQLPAMSTRSLKFKVPAATPIGRYDATVYLIGNRGIAEPFTISVHVTGKKPNWTVNPRDYEETMTLIGELYINNKAAEDEDDIVAAFDEAGNCIGLQQPVYNKRYDRYFTMMTIYSNSDINGQNVTFRVWDASTGEIHSKVVTSEEIMVASNALYGTITKPVELNATDLLEQQMKLAKGWQWKSLFVKPETMTIESVFAPVLAKTSTVKNQNRYAMVKNGKTVGSLKDMSVSTMYRINMTDSATLRVTGAKLSPQDEPIKLIDGWNWLGYTPGFSASPGYALAAAGPQNGDIIKSQRGFAYYQDYEWIGTLSAMEPGEGYMYKATSNRTFNYPSVAPQRVNKAPRRISNVDSVWHFGQPNYYAYPNTMTVTAKIMKDGQEVHGADVGFFIDDVNWASSEEIEEWYFINVTHLGNNIPIKIKVWIPGEDKVYDSSTPLEYNDDAIVGDLDNPFIISVGTSTGINEIESGSVTITPRHAKDKVVVTSGSPIRQLCVFNMQGAAVFSDTPSDVHRATISVSSLPNGIYFVDVLTADGHHTKQRIVKVD